MKRLNIILIAATLLLASTTTLSAQPHKRGGEDREQGNFMEFQINLLIKQLQLKESLQDDFREIYTEYSTNEREQRPQHGKPQDKEGEKMSDEEAEARIMASFEASERSIKKKREYYERFKTILSPQQILTMYNTERRIRERLNTEQDRRSGQ